MGLLNFVRNILPRNASQIAKAQELDNIISDLSILKTSGRPYTDTEICDNKYFKNAYSYGNKVSLYDVFILSKLSDIMVTIFNALKRKVFKKGFDIVPLVENPSEDQKKRIEKFIAEANENGQSLVEVLGEIEHDFNWADEGPLLCLKDYILSADKKTILGGEVKEILRLNPLSVERILDSQNRLGYKDGRNNDPMTVNKITKEESRKCYVKVTDRQTLVYTDTDPITGYPNLPVHYQVKTSAGYEYFNKSELLIKSKFNPSINGGFSPLFALYNKLITLIAMDYYVRQEYSSEKPSKKLLILKSGNVNSLITSIRDYVDKMKGNPHGFHPLAVGTEGSNNIRNIAEVVDFMKSLEEMQFTAVRNEYRNVAGAVYGVSPVFQNDVSTSGGLNNEGLQITVTNEAIESDKEIFDSEYLPFIFNKNMGITDWKVVTYPNEEEDEAWKEDLMSKKLANAQAFQAMGGSVKFEKEGSFVYEIGDLKPISDSSLSFDAFEDIAAFKGSKENGTNNRISNNRCNRDMDNDNNSITEKQEVMKPFAGYRNFDDCVNRNSDKKDPKAYCAVIMRQVEGKSLSKESKPIKNPEIPADEEKKFKTTLETELEKIIKKLDIKNKPTEKELKDTVNKLTKNLDKQLKAKSANRIKAIYTKAQDRLEKELGVKFKTDKNDREKIEALKRSEPFQKAFKNLSGSMNSRLKETIIKAYDDPKGLNINKLVESMKEELSKSDSEIRTIARTETTKISVAARKNVYEKTGADYKYFHIGPDDARTTKMSKKVKELTKNGVSWSEYVDIIEKVSKEYNPKWKVDPDAPITHPNTRHVPIGRRVKE